MSVKKEYDPDRGRIEHMMSLDEENQPGHHDIRVNVRHHTIVRCANCGCCRIISSNEDEELQKVAMKWAFGELFENECDNVPQNKFDDYFKVS